MVFEIKWYLLPLTEDRSSNPLVRFSPYTYTHLMHALSGDDPEARTGGLEAGTGALELPS